MPHERLGLLILRARTEPASTPSLRVDVRLTTDVFVGFERVFTSTDPDEIHAVVQAWLAGVVTD